MSHTSVMYVHIPSKWRMAEFEVINCSIEDGLAEMLLELKQKGMMK